MVQISFSTDRSVLEFFDRLSHRLEGVSEDAASSFLVYVHCVLSASTSYETTSTSDGGRLALSWRLSASCEAAILAAADRARVGDTNFLQAVTLK